MKIPKYPWGGKVMTILEKKQDKEEERVDIDMYKEVPTFSPTKEWALQRLDENEKARH